MRYRHTSRVWAAAAVAIEADHITITMPARVAKVARRRHMTVTVQKMMEMAKAADNALNRQAEMAGKSASSPIRTGPPCRFRDWALRPCRVMMTDTCGTSSVETGMAGSSP